MKNAIKIVATVLLLTGIIGFTAVSKQSADPGGGVQPNSTGGTL